MKKAMFYALVIGYGYPGLGRLMAVTSVKGTQLYGRDVEHGNPTHRRADDMTHAFRTEGEAREVIRLAQEAHRAHEEGVKEAERELSRRRNFQSVAVAKAVKSRALTFADLMAHLDGQGVQPGPGTVGRMQRRFRHAD